ncbi:tetratricopeptide repeat protein [Flavobacterium sp.]|uniref:tetratricopeptide repeat protein n=1 Tax=Flavobacterium sp. TaxID=239 RepID=UPI0038FCB02D
MKKSIIYIILFFSFAVSAQEKDKAMDQANQDYTENKFVEAEANYRISHSKFNKRTVSPYNLGNAIYKQNQIEEAKYAYAKAIENSKSKIQKHKIFHNLGNVFMKEKNYSEAVEAYKNALRNDPSDEETRYNFALAKKMLKENPPKNDKKKDKDKKDDKNKNKDKKDDNKDGDKDKKDDKGKEKDKPNNKEGKNEKNKDKPNENGKPKPLPGGISQQRLENLLDAVNNEEKNIQEKVNAKKVKGKPIQTEKDW